MNLLINFSFKKIILLLNFHKEQKKCKEIQYLLHLIFLEVNNKKKF